MDLGVCVKFALIVLGATFSQGFFLSVTHKSESGSIRMKPPSPSQADQ